VHGAVVLAEDVDAVVIDPSFGGKALLAAAVAGEHDPQQLKYLWRMTVAYGA
jgi:hypothetical protein